MYKKAVEPPPPPPSMWDIAFGAAIMSDYNFRGISQSDRGPSVAAYFEPRFNITPNVQLYAGIGGLSVKLPTAPTAEVDIYGGIRPTFGNLALDFGFLYYYYPRETQQFCGDVACSFVTPTNLGLGAFTLRNTDFWEVYGKAAYTFSDVFTLGANVYYADNWLNSGFSGTYASGTAKLASPSGLLGPDVGAYLSGELGGYWFSGPVLVDYTYWNVGVGLTYKAFTLDFRYHDTDLTRAECFTNSGDLHGLPTGSTPGASKWCGSTFIVKLSADTTLAALK
jgi:uncharacterized protein (TIGR02001 family)